MRRIATLLSLAGTATALLLPGSASAGELYDTCRAQSPAEVVVLTQGPCKLVEKAGDGAAATCRNVGGPDEACTRVPFSSPVSRRKLERHERTWLHRTLAFQYERAAGVPFTDVQWIGTHNSFNSVKTVPGVSELDANQQLSLTDQLRLDVRSLELDLHTFSSARDQFTLRPMVCHAQGGGYGCSTERELAEVLPEIRDWLKAHEDQVLLLYLEDDLGDVAAHDAAVAAIDEVLGSLVLPTAGRSFDTLTREAVRDAGAQVVLVGNAHEAKSWSSRVFAWRPFEWESRPQGFAADCTNEHGAERPPYATKLVRFFEDSTWLSPQTELTGLGSADDGLTPETVRRMVRCGVDLFGLDQVVPGDKRLDAFAWSWAPKEVSRKGCATMDEDARWYRERCDAKLRAACLTDAGTWAVSKAAVPREALRGVCSALDAVPAAPRTGAENAALAEVADGERVWLTL
jgi:hypothetical protein